MTQQFDSILILSCRMCKEGVTLRFNKVDYLAWQKGELIQRAFPYLSANQREMLKTQICGKCFDKLFA